MSKHGLNQATAGDFIYDYRQLVEGKEFHRAMSSDAMRYFISKIEADRGPLGLQNAITSLRAHIEYYEAISKSTMHSMRRIVSEAERSLSSNASWDLNCRMFESEVTKSLGDSRENRLQRLLQAQKMPKTLMVQTAVFVRNPDVVAEVLIRARGHCEQCKKPAPFLRAKDGSPYLEVHHIIQLSQGGEDSVSNAIALCPNCHRMAHFGVPA
nr:HNH endonuclease [Dechloromonas sp.]